MKKQGFTIVELLVVIVVIAILAAISVFAYNGVQAKARDADRISDLQEIADAIKQYRTKTGHDIQTVGTVKADCGRYEADGVTPMGGGSSNAGGGWFNYESTSTTNYSVSLLHCLMFKGYLNESVVDPTGCASTTGTPAPGRTCSTTGYAYMKYSCTIGGQTVTYVYARLEAGGDSVKTRASGGCSATSVVDNWGMNYYVVAD